MDKMTHLDAAQTLFFTRELEFIKAQSYDTKYAELRGLTQGLIPIDTGTPSGIKEITYRSYTAVGEAKIIADYAHDIPRVDLYGVENSIKPKMLGSSYGYNVMEIRRAALAGLALESRRAAEARKSIDRAINKIALLGDADHNLNGFIDYPGMPEYTLINDGTGTSKLWAAKTPTQILRDLNGILTDISETTNGVENATTIVLPLAKYNYIRSTLIGTASDTTILEFFQRTNPEVRVTWLNELKNAGDGGSIDRMIAYTNNANSLELHIPNAFEQMETEYRNLEYIVPCIAECAGVVFYYPYSAAFADGL